MATILIQDILVSDCDRKLISPYYWCVTKRGYIVARDKKTKKNIAIHQLILPGAMAIDHINGDKLDNRRENLRECTQAQNLLNKAIHKDNKIGYKGVHEIKATGLYRAVIQVDGRSIHLGCFATKELAALAYNEAAKVYHKEFARLNNVIPSICSSK